MTFLTWHDLFQFKRLAPALCKTLRACTSEMDLVLQGMSSITVFAFLDDVCVLGKIALGGSGECRSTQADQEVRYEN